MTKKILTENHPRIAKDWDIEKNSPLLPEQVSSYSRYIIWWCCSENHKYQVSVELSLQVLLAVSLLLLQE